MLADQVTSLNTHRETQTQLVKKLEEREKALQNAVVWLVFLTLRDKLTSLAWAFFFCITDPVIMLDRLLRILAFKILNSRMYMIGMILRWIKEKKL